MVLAELSHPAQNDRPTLDFLTEREVEVLRLVVQGLSNKDIAEQLAISLETARRHVSRILMKLHVANRAEAASYVLRMGISDLDDYA